MLLELNGLTPKAGEPLYLQLYNQIKAEIDNGALKQGEKLPSIRNLSYDSKVSKTTVQTAYDQLAVEGYIENKPKRGYFVLAQNPMPLEKQSDMPEREESRRIDTPYNFSSRGIDKDSMDTKRWRSLMKEVLLQEEQLSSYGHPQGQLALRTQLRDYSRVARGVRATESQIVVGAGVIPLLYILCGLMREKTNTVGLEESGFPVAEQAFLDSGLNVVPLQSDDQGITLQSLQKSAPGAVLLSPSKASENMPAMPLNRRVDLLEYARKNNIYLLEDDYNGELRFLAKPIPALQSIDKSGQVIYIGSFSKLLLPSVRISYMVLPEELLQKYRKVSHRYNQTASKVEQMAFAKYLKDGSMQKHIRKLRKVYSEKAKLLIENLNTCFDKKATVTLQETALRVVVKVKTTLGVKEFEKKAKEVNLYVEKGLVKEGKGELTVILGFSAIEKQNIAPGVQLLKEILKSD